MYPENVYHTLTVTVAVPDDNILVSFQSNIKTLQSILDQY